MTESLLQFWFLLHLISRDLHGSWKWNAVWSVSTPVNRNVTELSATLALGVQQFYFCSLAFEANSKIPNWLLGTGFWLLVDKRKHAETNWRMESSGLKGKPAARGNDTQTQREAARTLNAKTFTLHVRIHISDSAFWSTEFQRPVLYV